LAIIRTFNHVDQNYTNSQNEFLWTLLANPANDAHLYAYNLQRLVNDFPQSGILQALLAHASDEKDLRKASAYFNSKSLYKLINTPSAFTRVDNDNIIIQNNIAANGHYKRHEPSIAEYWNTRHESIDHNGTEAFFNEQQVAETDEEKPAHDTELPAIEHEPIAVLNNEHHLTDIIPEVETVVPAIEEYFENKISEAHEELSPEIERVHYVPESNDSSDDRHTEEPVEESKPVEQEYKHHEAAADEQPRPIENKEEHHEATIHDETYDEIVGIEQINTEPEVIQPVADEPKREDTRQPEENHKAHDTLTFQPEETGQSQALKAEEEKLIAGGIVGTDYLMFDRTFGGHIQAKPVEHVSTPEPAASKPAIEQPLPADEHQDVSKYHDEKMPYTFMWWLDKTRKEHASIYQPYVKSETGVTNTNNKAKKPTDELQQQYYENIFHITSVEDLDKNTPPPQFVFNAKRKEQVIIERFIQEEPQIKPQSSDKIDNENKAKKSSEDRDELVTETLAGIYSDQMLYHKAIASYKKLILKFPEKSSYFAGKIEQLEKKTN
jgi:hypothetical protein